MALISNNLTEEQKLLKTKGELDALLMGGARSLYCYASQVFTQFWSNPQGLSCQQVFDIFGADALAMAHLLLSAKAMIDKIDPTMWKLDRPGVVTPILGEDGKPTGFVSVALND